MLAARALTELLNKQKCHKLEQLPRNQQSQASELTTATSMKLKHNYPALCHHSDVATGTYMHVFPDMSSGMCSFGGNEFVTAINGDGILRAFTVQYDKCGSSRIETGICYSRLPVIPFGLAKLVRERRQLPELRTNAEHLEREQQPLLYQASMMHLSMVPLMAERRDGER